MTFRSGTCGSVCLSSRCATWQPAKLPPRITTVLVIVSAGAEGGWLQRLDVAWPGGRTRLQTQSSSSSFNRTGHDKHSSLFLPIGMYEGHDAGGGHENIGNAGLSIILYLVLRAPRRSRRLTAWVCRSSASGCNPGSNGTRPTRPQRYRPKWAIRNRSGRTNIVRDPWFNAAESMLGWLVGGLASLSGFTAVGRLSKPGQAL